MKKTHKVSFDPAVTSSEGRSPGATRKSLNKTRRSEVQSEVSDNDRLSDARNRYQEARSVYLSEMRKGREERDEASTKAISNGKKGKAALEERAESLTERDVERSTVSTKTPKDKGSSTRNREKTESASVSASKKSFRKSQMKPASSTGTSKVDDTKAAIEKVGEKSILSSKKREKKENSTEVSSSRSFNGKETHSVRSRRSTRKETHPVRSNRAMRSETQSVRSRNTAGKETHSVRSFKSKSVTSRTSSAKVKRTAKFLSVSMSTRVENGKASEDEAESSRSASETAKRTAKFLSVSMTPKKKRDKYEGSKKNKKVYILVDETPTSLKRKSSENDIPDEDDVANDTKVYVVVEKPDSSPNSSHAVCVNDNNGELQASSKEDCQETEGQGGNSQHLLLCSEWYSVKNKIVDKIWQLRNRCIPSSGSEAPEEIVNEQRGTTMLPSEAPQENSDGFKKTFDDILQLDAFPYEHFVFGYDDDDVDPRGLHLGGTKAGNDASGAVVVRNDLTCLMERDEILWQFHDAMWKKFYTSDVSAIEGTKKSTRNSHEGKNEEIDEKLLRLWNDIKDHPRIHDVIRDYPSVVVGLSKNNEEREVASSKEERS